MELTGQQITELRPIGSMFHNGCIGVYADGEYYLMKVTEILKFDTDFNGVKFKVVKKKKYNYLEVV